MGKHNHHCGVCSCCGGEIPCGEYYVRRWRKSVEGGCPGSTNNGLCGALASVRLRRERKIDGCKV